MFAISLNIDVNASEIQTISSELYHQEINPIYNNANINNSYSKNKRSLKVKTSQEFNIEDYKEDKNLLACDVRDYMVSRENEFVLYSKLILNKEIDQSTFDKYVSDLINMAMSEELANSSSAGDYLKWSWNSYNVYANFAYQYINSTYIYYLNLNFNFVYYTTNEQELILNTHIQNYIKQNIDIENDTVYEKAKNIYDYITENVRYDYTNLNDNNYTLKYTAYAAMENKTAVCQGYAALFYKMAKDSGINDVRMITSSTHAWNIIRIGILYYNLDSTFDEGNTVYNYFLKGSDNFQEVDHIRSLEYCTDEFRKKYPTSTKDYDLNKTNYNMNECNISLLTSYVYCSSYIMPTVNISYEDYQLVQGRDYTVICENNYYPGTAKIIIKGINYFTGQIERSFDIYPAKMTGLKVSKNYTNKIKLKWNKQNAVTGYKLYKYNSKTKKYEYIKTLNANTTSYNVKKLSAGNSYSFRIRAYLDKDGKRYYGEYSDIIYTATLPDKVTISSVKSGSKKMTVKWKKVSACTGYEIQYSTSSKFKSSKTKTVRVDGRKTVSKTIKKLKRGTKYYVRIRAYKTVNGKRYYGSYSKTKYIRIR